MNALKQRILFFLARREYLFKNQFLRGQLKLGINHAHIAYQRLQNIKLFLLVVSCALSLQIISSRLISFSQSIDLDLIDCLYMLYTVALLAFLAYSISCFYSKLRWSTLSEDTVISFSLTKRGKSNRLVNLIKILTHFMFILILPLLVYKAYVILLGPSFPYLYVFDILVSFFSVLPLKYDENFFYYVDYCSTLGTKDLSPLTLLYNRPKTTFWLCSPTPRVVSRS